MVMQHILAFAVAFVLSCVITPLVIRLATLTKAIDIPDKRKIHGQPTPRLGGVAIFISFFLAILLAMFRFPGAATLPWVGSSIGIVLFMSCCVVLALGVIDDIRQLGPSTKFLVELAVTTCIYIAGVRISVVSYPFGSGHLELGLLSYPVTVLWIIGIMNALNLVDGLDGLASGVSVVAAITISVVSYSLNDMGTALVALTLAGAVAGFLPHNFYPARIFLGDSGSLFLGFVLGVLSILGSTKGSTAFAVSVPVLALGLPIADTILSVVRRFLRPLIPGQRRSVPLPRLLKSLFMPDRDHIHHRLLALGLSQRSAVLLLYVVSSALGCTALGLSVTSKTGSLMIFSLVMTAVLYGIHRLNYREIAIFKNGALLSLYNSSMMRRRVFQVIVDWAFVAVAGWLSWSLATWNKPGAAPGEHFLVYSAATAFAQIVVFWVVGLYRGTYCHASIADALRITKAALLAVIVAGIIYVGIGDWSPQFTVLPLVMNFFFLLTFAGGWRFSYRVLSHLNQQQGDGKRKVLIYGAGSRGAATLQLILRSPGLQIWPVGFIDDNPTLEGKKMNGYRIFGGHWKIQRLVNSMDVKEIIVATDSLRPEVARRLALLSRANKVKAKVLSMHLEDERVEIKVSRQPSVPSELPSVANERDRHRMPETLVPAVLWGKG